MLVTLSLSIPNPDEPGFFVDQRSFSGTGLEGVESSFAMALQPAMPKVLVLTSRSVTLGFKANPMHNIFDAVVVQAVVGQGNPRHEGAHCDSGGEAPHLKRKKEG